MLITQEMVKKYDCFWQREFVYLEECFSEPVTLDDVLNRYGSGDWLHMHNYLRVRVALCPNLLSRSTTLEFLARVVDRNVSRYPADMKSVLDRLSNCLRSDTSDASLVNDLDRSLHGYYWPRNWPMQSALYAYTGRVADDVSKFHRSRSAAYCAGKCLPLRDEWKEYDCQLADLRRLVKNGSYEPQGVE